MAQHQIVRLMYSWDDVAQRTEKVYFGVIRHPELSLADRFVRYNGCGIIAGKLAVMIIAVNYLFFVFLEWLSPRHVGLHLSVCLDNWL